MKYSTVCNKFLKNNEVNTVSIKHDNDEGSFSNHGCDCCNTGLGNNVYECIGYNPNTKQVVDLGDVCSQCICYFYNGDDGNIES